METIVLADGYSRNKRDIPQAEYRYMTPDEAKSLTHGAVVPILSTDGKARNVRVSGAVKTWKRNAARVEIPCKYGMYESGRFYASDGKMVSNGGAVLMVKIGDCK
jgi:hypothetical protein